ncbi:MAG TPA: DUF4058 family protein [Candidatus Tectomicrobia bacterium]
MPSPFPGMDPYLEGYLWPDVHSALAHTMRQQLAPQIQPKYVARIEISVIEDYSPEVEVGIMYPDIDVLKVRARSPSAEVPGAMVGAGAVASITAPLTIPLPQVRLATVAIRDVAQNILVTSIEILSPVNKREPNLSHYRQKRERLREANVHLLEIDLLRRGTRAWMHPRLPDVPYLVLLTRAEASTVEVWPIKLHETLPSLPVPLRAPDPEAILDLSAALRTIYDAALYHLSLDYTQDPPPPTLSNEELTWLSTQLAPYRSA